MSLMTATQCFVYVCLVNSITCVWVYVGHVRWMSFQTLALAMYLPTTMALIFSDDHIDLVIQVLGIRQPLDALLYSGVAIFAVFAMVGACLVLVLYLGWAQLNPSPDASPVHPHNSEFIWGFLRACGEEMGWRCFLLPALMADFSPGLAITLSGIAWGLFHVPVLILMTTRLEPPKPRLTIAVQCLAVALSAFPHGWVAIQSGYSIWAAGLMHAVWNQINPVMLGSIYTQTPGAVKGEQWLINGEGLAGCLVLLPLAFWITWSL